MRGHKFCGIQTFISGKARFFPTVWGARLRLRLPKLRPLSSGMACECPVMRQSCLCKSPALSATVPAAQTATLQMPRCRDAQLRNDLQRVLGLARLLFEAALERVAAAEGLLLP
jgi:hypothetical protein